MPMGKNGSHEVSSHLECEACRVFMRIGTGWIGSRIACRMASSGYSGHSRSPLRTSLSLALLKDIFGYTFSMVKINAGPRTIKASASI